MSRSILERLCLLTWFMENGKGKRNWKNSNSFLQKPYLNGNSNAFNKVRNHDLFRRLHLVPFQHLEPQADSCWIHLSQHFPILPANGGHILRPLPQQERSFCPEYAGHIETNLLQD